MTRGKRDVEHADPEPREQREREPRFAQGEARAAVRRDETDGDEGACDANRRGRRGSLACSETQMTGTVAPMTAATGETIPMRPVASAA